MTVIYVPRLVESAEQAEALPIGTLARDPLPSLEDVGEWDVAQFAGNGMWLSGGTAWTHRYVIGWTALVSIEVEEETREHPTRVEERPESAYLQPVQQVRYKTRWESA